MTRTRASGNHVHALINGAKEHFASGRTVEEGAYLRPYKKLLVDVSASQAGLGKTLELANDLFTALTSIGHRVTLAPAEGRFRRQKIDERAVAVKPRDYWHKALWSPARPTVVYVKTVAIGLAIVEMSESISLRYLNGKYIRESEYVAPHNKDRGVREWTTMRDLPSGRIRIVAYSPYPRVAWSKQWQEEQTQPLTDRIKSIVHAITAMAPELAAKLQVADRRAEAERRQWEAVEERRRREEDSKRVKQSIIDSKADLQQVIERWSELMSIERFLSQVEQRADDLPEPDKRSLLERLALARSFLGNHDPLEFFLNWKTPQERYAPRFPDESVGVLRKVFPGDPCKAVDTVTGGGQREAP